MVTAVQIQDAIALWGLRGTLKKLPAEKDDNYVLQTYNNEQFILKVSAVNETWDVIEFQTTVLNTLAQRRQSFEFPIPQASIAGKYIETVRTNDGKLRFVRLFSFVPGQLLGEITNNSELLYKSAGKQIGCLIQALADIRHPGASRYLKWDLQQASWIQDHLVSIKKEDDRTLVEKHLNSYEKDVRNKLLQMRQQIIHGDLNDYNLLATQNSLGEIQITGLIDFGDMVMSAAIGELAIALAYMLMNKAEPLNTAYHVIKACHAVFPFEEDEVAILYDLICIRLCVSVVNSAIRKRENPHDQYLTISEKPAWELLKKLEHISRDQALTIFREACHHMSNNQIQEKRRQYIGKNVGLSYQEPLQFVRGEGPYLYDQNGCKYLDGVNNVCHVGHCHPYVVKSGQRQMALLNTNTRYLHELLVNYAEKLLEKFPAPLEVCFFVSSGSEANELALRLARTHTGRRNLVVMDHAYHGNTTTLIDISPYKFNGKGGHGKPDFVRVMPMPDPLRHRHLTVDEQLFDQSIAAFIAEPFLSCGGQVELPQGYLQAAYDQTRKVGGVCIADEVQIGFGRVGSHFWGFETQGVVPDIVTMGKPIGNGHPIGAVVTTRAIADSFSNGMEYFSTFGGNPVSCAIGLAVLEVIEQENLQTNAYDIGNYLKSRFNNLKSQYPVIGDVRGRGLFLGIELVTDSQSLNPNPELAERIVNDMKEKRVLLSTDGPHHNVIKFKPPMVFSRRDADFLIKQLIHTLTVAARINSVLAEPRS
ncbi:aminotransferase class III-fold pyridoxal phosphate-dependent enzyme [Legionella waltersii]|uniref:Aminotransferase class-III n=1 Tax=Legionella waltersii TaxID=66969 RepID=A0A0W1ADI6_9GAMM|nr:aminotransferase class III-fold pyridoxal phosphate-dependent enzyme [Legionella waltersii]KTD79388.1 aminotransferase class-III [Legionella waltersii]SNU99639.1 aminotransferase class-III [Legionella waltersii]